MELLNHEQTNNNLPQVNCVDQGSVLEGTGRIIANTLLELQNQKIDDETDWMADRALHNEHIHNGSTPMFTLQFSGSNLHWRSCNNTVNITGGTTITTDVTN